MNNVLLDIIISAILFCVGLFVGRHFQQQARTKRRLIDSILRRRGEIIVPNHLQEIIKRKGQELKPDDLLR